MKIHERMYRRIFSSVLAFVLIMAMAVSPLSSLKAEAADDGIVEFRVSGEKELSFEEGAEIDLTDNFVLYWNDDPLTFMQDRDYVSYYSKDTAPDGELTMADAYTVSYYDSDGYELAGAPTKAGVYTAKAALTSSDVYYWTGLYNWCHADKVDSEVITITVGTPADSAEEGAAIKFKGESQTFTEGEEIDLSGSFKVCYNNQEVYALYAYADGKYYLPVPEEDTDDLPIGSLLVYTFYDADGKELSEAPTEPGVYSVSAALPEGNYYAYADSDWTEIDYYKASASAKYKITITAASTANAPLTEGLAVKFVGKKTSFTEGETVDFTNDFTIELNGVEPVIIFDGYQGEDGNWIWGTGTDKDYVNYSNTFDGYVPFSDLYTIHYYDKNGVELSEAPTKPGNYYVAADVFDISAAGGRRCIYVKYGYDETTYQITEDEHYYYEGGATSERTAFSIVDANQIAKKNFQAKSSSIKSVKSPKKKTAKVTWKKVSGAKGYVIQYSKKSNFKGAKTVTVKSASKKTATIKKLSSKKKYFVRVRAYTTIAGKKVYTKWSAKKSVKVK